MTEQWKSLTIDDRYEVSDLGRIRFMGSVVHAYIGSHGYRVIYLRQPTGRKFLLHRLICEAFHGASDKETVNHIDGDKLNNSALNLEWASYMENNHHAFSSGLMKFPPSQSGENNPKSKLTKEDVLYILENPDQLLGTQLARKFLVSPSAISAIKRRHSWTNPESFWVSQREPKTLTKVVLRGTGLYQERSE